VGLSFIYALLTFGRVLCNVGLKPASTPNSIQELFRLELAGYAAFWIFVPPLWFYLDYFVVANGCIRGIAEADIEKQAKKTKDFADSALKVWAAVLAALYFLVKGGP
jgi:hypothetical protein